MMRPIGKLRLLHSFNNYYAFGHSHSDFLNTVSKAWFLYMICNDRRRSEARGRSVTVASPIVTDYMGTWL